MYIYLYVENPRNFLCKERSQEAGMEFQNSQNLPWESFPLAYVLHWKLLHGAHGRGNKSL